MESMPEVGIKESMEILEFVEVCAEAMHAAKADDKIDWRDLLSAETRAMIPAMMAAVKDSKLVSEELKNLSPEEINSLLEKMTQVMVALVTAVIS